MGILTDDSKLESKSIVPEMYQEGALLSLPWQLEHPLTDLLPLAALCLRRDAYQYHPRYRHLLRLVIGTIRYY